MKQHQIPGTDLNVSALCLGCAEFGTKHPENAAYALLDRFIELGGNFFDTARIYSDWIPGETGRSERILGGWIAERGNRDEVVIATKGGHFALGRPPAEAVSRVTKVDVQRDLELTLQALRVDYVDIYYLHRDNPALPAEEIIEWMNALVAAGKVRHVACSNWCTERIEAAHAHAIRHGLQPFLVSQCLWNIGSKWMRPPGDPTMFVADGPMLQMHSRTNMVACPYSSQASGFFSKFLQNPDPAAFSGSGYATPGNFALAKTIADVVCETGLTATQLVLGYLQSQPYPVFPVIGSHTIAQLDDTATGADVRLAEEIVRRLDS